MYSNYLHTDTAALFYNATTIINFVNVPVIGVIKCGGYGISTLEAAKAWQAAGAEMFAVSQADDALILRSYGFRENILLLSPVCDKQVLNELLKQDITLTVTSKKCAEFYLSNSYIRPIHVHTAVDTGMGRFGVKWTDIRQLREIYFLSGLIFEGIFSHFSSSFEAKYRQTKVQLERFLSVTDTLLQEGYSIGIRHIANSCAALRFPETQLDAVRIGSALIGRLCCSVPVSLRPAVSFYAQVTDVKKLFFGDTTGYGSKCMLKSEKRAVVVAVGYFNGFGYDHHTDIFCFKDLLSYIRRCIRYPILKPYVTYNGIKLPLIGRIGNEYTLFDSLNLDIFPGDYVTVEVPLMFPHRSQAFGNI